MTADLPGRFRLAALLMLSDLAVVAGSLWLAMQFAETGVWEREFRILLFALGPMTALVFQAGGAYERGPAESRVRIGRSLLCFLVLFALFLVAAYGLKASAQFSRLVIGTWLAFAIAGLIGVRLIVQEILASRLRRGLGAQQILLIGSAGACAAMRQHLDEHQDLGLRVAAVLEPGRDAEAACATLPNLVAEHHIQRILVVGDLDAHTLVLHAARALRHTPVALQYAPDLSTLPLFCMRIADCGGRPLISISASPFTDAARTLKAIEDRVLAGLALLIFAPLMALIAVLIRCTSPGPILFVQERHGLGGRAIRVFKFRTMHHGVRREDPEQPALEPRNAVAAPLPAAPAAATAAPAAATQAPTRSDLSPDDFRQAVPGDARITKLGAFLRRLSLDELPQLFNVLRGDMSLVGPRPHAIRHNEQFAVSIEDLMRRHYVKPGITGLAQISGARGETRSVADMRRRIDYDLEYIRTWSLWLDLRILALTVLRGFYTRQP